MDDGHVFLSPLRIVIGLSYGLRLIESKETNAEFSKQIDHLHKRIILAF